MKRLFFLILLVAVPLVVAVAVLSLAVVRADRAESSAAQVRLALWRLDAQAGALLVAEASRAPEAYRSFYSPEVMGGDSRALVPSPLLALPEDPVLVHVQVEADGQLRSPQVPERSLRARAVPAHTTAAAIATAEDRLLSLAASAQLMPGGFPALAARLPALADRDLVEAQSGNREPESRQRLTAQRERKFLDEIAENAETKKSASKEYASQATPGQQAESVSAGATPTRMDLPASQLSGENPLNSLVQPTQQERNQFNDFDQRVHLNRQAQNLALKNGPNNNQLRNSHMPAGGSLPAIDATPGNISSGENTRLPVAPSRRPAENLFPKHQSQVDKPATQLPTEPAEAGPMQAQWLGKHLLFMRRARLDGHQVTQAAVVDWPMLRDQLAATVGDLLPDARLEPVTENDISELRLAVLPACLVPHSLAPVILRPAARWTLITAWLGTAIGIAGAALLLILAHRLGERRAAFVSAVTHELRTPLTSLRLHADLLADQRIANDPIKRAGRIAVLRSEAGRLAHLIDNVLDYARLERRRPPTPKRMVVSELIAPLLPRLIERLASAGLALECQALPAATVACDPAAVERILANLADNAAKYATSVKHPSVVLRVLIADRRLELRLRDHGPGLAPDVRARLFVPFARSAETAAGNAPGVGLGLALCRRLARAQGGDLRLDDPADGCGVEAVLTLPLAG